MTTLQTWIDEVRTSLEDYGDTITDSFTGDGTTKVMKFSSPPAKTASEVVTVNAVVQTNPTNYTVNYDNGEITFVVAPPNGQAVVAKYIKVVWRDERLISAINGGIRRLYPKVYRQGELYVNIQNLKQDYNLTDTTDVPDTFSSFTLPSVTKYPEGTVDQTQTQARRDIRFPQTRIGWAEIMPFGSNQQFVEYSYFRRYTPTSFHVDLVLVPSSVIKLVYAAPLTVLSAVGDISDVPDEFYYGPVWYALSIVMEKKEPKRVRYDQLATMQNQNATPPGTQIQTAEDFLARYHDMLNDNQMRPLKMRQRRELRSWQFYQRY